MAKYIGLILRQKNQKRARELRLRSTIEGELKNACGFLKKGVRFKRLYCCGAPVRRRRRVAGIAFAKTAGAAGRACIARATCIPIGCLIASSRNPEAFDGVFDSLAEEAAGYGIDVILAQNVNLHRYPLCGGSFEYYSEFAYSFDCDIGLSRQLRTRRGNLPAETKRFQMPKKVKNKAE